MNLRMFSLVILLCLGIMQVSFGAPLFGEVSKVGIGKVGVDLQTIDWGYGGSTGFVPPEPAPDPNGTGRFLIIGGSDDFAALIGTQGTIMNLSLLTVVPGVPVDVADFMTYDAAPNQSAHLTMLHQGVYGAAECAAAPAAGQVCTPILPGGVVSPFNLSNTSASSSTVAMTVDIVMYDTLTGESLPGYGIFTSQFPSNNYQELLSVLVQGGVVANSYSAAFFVVPEPSTLALAGLGGLFVLVGTLRRRRKP